MIHLREIINPHDCEDLLLQPLLYGKFLTFMRIFYEDHH